jgi:hypothetical protein
MLNVCLGCQYNGGHPPGLPTDIPPEPNYFCSDSLLLPNVGCSSDPNCQCPPALGGHGGFAVSHVGRRRRQDMVLPIWLEYIQCFCSRKQNQRTECSKKLAYFIQPYNNGIQTGVCQQTLRLNQIILAQIAFFCQPWVVHPNRALGDHGGLAISHVYPHHCQDMQ